MPKTYDSNSITKIYLFIFTIVAIISFALLAFTHSPLNIKSTSLLTDPRNELRASFASNGEDLSGVTRFRTADNLVEFECNVTDETPILYCGAALSFPREQGSEESFEKVDEFSLDINVWSDAPEYDGRMRIFIKTIMEGGYRKYPKNSDVKYHAVRIRGNGEKHIPINRFDVETWWQSQYKVEFDEADKDFSKIHSMEFSINDVPLTTGHYKVTVSNLVSHAHYINKRTLNKWLLYDWVICLFLFLLHYAWFNNRLLRSVRKDASFDVHTGLLNAVGFEHAVRSPEFNDGHLYLVKITNWQNVVKHFGVDTAHYLVTKSAEHLQEALQGLAPIIATLENDEIAVYLPNGRLDFEQESAMFDSLTQGDTLQKLGHIRLEVKIGIIRDAMQDVLLDGVIDKARQVVQSILGTHEDIRMFTDEIHEAIRYSAYIEQEVRKSLAEDKFYLLYLPVYDAQVNQIVGAEALLRSSLDSLSGLSPQVYVTVAEKTGLIREIDRMVIGKSLKALESVSLPDDFTISINISSQELLDTTFIERFEEAVNASSISPSQLRLEITETSFVDLNQANTCMLERLRSFGCRISLDDFGTGYTSFNHLKNIPVDEIKIDRGFVNEMDEYETGVIIQSMITIARAFKYDLVAEGIETQLQLKRLREMGCVYFQGYYISKPTQLSDVIDLNDRLKSKDLSLLGVL
ncbi:EAL domain-containing protein [Marinomonas mediterranea]|uniref:EAL domain-containing protein n=1 Tax=Marinomonas mediterranea TaxID=119864 RepID=UPI00234A6A57|nr:EAL domain-containing protein [Marinomonas mediterranea]WCN11051.1 EAL domain-containing protein [Marinomonas mediterranea]